MGFQYCVSESLSNLPPLFISLSKKRLRIHAHGDVGLEEEEEGVNLTLILTGRGQFNPVASGMPRRCRYVWRTQLRTAHAWPVFPGEPADGSALGTPIIFRSCFLAHADPLHSSLAWPRAVGRTTAISEIAYGGRYRITSCDWATTRAAQGMCAGSNQVHLEVEFEFSQVLFANVSIVVWSPAMKRRSGISPFTAGDSLPSHPHDNGEYVQTVSECNL